MSWDFPSFPGLRWGDGYVYYVAAGELGRVKIGYTRKSPLARLKALQTGSPARLRMLAYHPGDPTTEQRLHQEFAKDRLHGEWFELSDDLIVHLASVYKMTMAVYISAGLPKPRWAEAGLQGLMKMLDEDDE